MTFTPVPTWTPLSQPLRGAATRARSGNARAGGLLALLVFVSFVVRTGLAWLQATPVYYPDEYMYSAMSRSLLESGRPLVRGGAVHMPAMLVPLLDAPAWLVGGVATGYRLVQTEQSLAISLSALPVYWLARRLQVDGRGALVAAALTLVVPDVVFSSFLLSESFALPLFLAAACAAVAALDRGGPRRWTAFVGLAALAAAARLQFLILVPLVLLAGIGIETRRRRPAAAARLAAGLVALVVPAAVGAEGIGASRFLGLYSGLLHAHVDAGPLLVWGSFNGIVLALATGWVVVPGAVLFVVRSLAHPRSRTEEAFAGVTAPALAVLVGQGALFAAGGIQVMERYTFYASPLLIVAFVCAWQGGMLRGRSHAALALALGGLGLLMPRFSGLFFSRPDHAPSLLAYEALHGVLSWRAPLVFAGFAAALGAATLVLGRSGRGNVLVVLAGVVCLALTFGARVQLYDTAAAAAQAQGGQLAFADLAGARGASYLTFADTAAANAQQVEFWNRSVVRLLRFTGAPGDGFASLQAAPAPSGRLLVRGRPLAAPLVVDLTAAFVRFDRPPRARTGAAELVGPAAELRQLVDGYVSRGDWLAAQGTFAAWPDAPGRGTHGSLVLRLWGGHGSVLRLAGPGCHRTIRVTRAPILVRLRFDARGPWRCRFEAVRGTLWAVDGHLVAVHARIVRFGEQAAPPRATTRA